MSLLKKYGKKLSIFFGFFASIPFRFYRPKIFEPIYVSNMNWLNYLEKKFNHSGMRVLEIGSRNVTGANLRNKFSKAEYIGFDFYPGENVDVCGDVHKLTNYFPEDNKFDLIFSSAVFEHLHMPWIAAFEMQKLLKVGGYIFVETHFSFSSHERPWHFFQFSDKGLRALFNSSMGFDLIDSGMSNPISGYFSHYSHHDLRYKPVSELYCHSEILCKKQFEVEDFNWSMVEIDGVVEGTRYPPPQ
jgi:hypothetical protein